ncbi:MAG: metallophosphoesterase [Prevotella sp.]|nr:metallophosphoesterase [Prevotella sp.]
MIRKIVFLLTVIATLMASAQDRLDFKQLKGEIDLMVVSDIGRNGYYDQKPIASLMGSIAEQASPDAVLALGDTHHYMGVQSVDDPLWLTNYELIYSHPELQVKWYPLLGNHEYRGSTQAVLDYSGKSRRWEMPARYYSKTFKGGDATLRVIFLDTPALIDKYHKAGDYPDAEQQDIDAQLRWLDKELAEAKENWTIVVGHHPIYAYTDKEDAERADMQKRVDAILRRHKVDMYICGHIHNFQHIRMPKSNIDYIVNTSGSLSRPVKETDGTLFCSGESGISYLSASKDSISLNMIDKQGNILHTVTRFK